MNGEYSINHYNYNGQKNQGISPVFILLIILLCSLSSNLLRSCSTNEDEGQLDIPLLDKKELTDEGLLDEKCVICLENYQTKEKITRLNCNHTFHYKCLSTWVKTESTCPLCRFSLL